MGTVSGYAPTLAAPPRAAEDARERLGRERLRAQLGEGVSHAPEALLDRQGDGFLQAHKDSPGEAAGQLLWALVAGPEFLTNH